MKKNQDILVEEVLNFIRNRKKISCRALQKKFGIGYTRAAYILDSLEKQGKVSPAQPGRARKVASR